MQMTKQRKLLIGVAVLGLCAFVLDRTVLGPPESASANVAPVQPPASPPPGDASALPPQALQPTPGNAGQTAPASLPSFATLTDRLMQTSQTTVDPVTLNDPFSLPSGWNKAAATTALPVGTATANQSAESLLQQYKLDGTFRSKVREQTVMMAVVSGGGYERKVMAVGDEINVKQVRQPLQTEDQFDVYRLIEIGNRVVIWALKRDPSQTVEMNAEEVL